MKRTFFYLTLILFITSSCAYFKKVRGPKESNKLKTNYNDEFVLTDKSGKFSVLRESGFGNKGKEYIVKKRVFLYGGDRSKILEQSIVISSPGTLKGETTILRPKISQYTVWFENKKYFSELKLNLKEKTLDISLKSPEKQWNGNKKVPFPKGTGVFCFYSQIIECANISKFIKMSSEKETGKMNFHVIWDGYPYFQEQFDNLPSNVFSEAILEFDGRNKMGQRRFTLNVAGQSIFYFIDSKNRLIKQFWVAQGLSMEKDFEKQ